MGLTRKAELDHFEELFKANYKALCKLAFRILKDSNASEDVVQEVFMKVWNNRKQLNIKVSEKAYLFRSVYNAALDYLDKWKRLKPSDDISSTGKEPSVTERKLEEQELDALLNHAMEKLPPKCRAIFCLSRYDGMKHREIAEHLGISIKTVEAQIAIALDRLKQDLMPYLKDSDPFSEQ